MKNAVIFDLDGLMIDSERATFACYQKVLAKTDRTISVEFYTSLLGTNYDNCSRALTEEYGEALDSAAVMAQVQMMLMGLLEKQDVALKPGLLELLDYLKKEGYQTIIATSSPRERVELILAQYGLRSYFDRSLCGDEVVKGKPDPEIFLNACRMLACAPQEAYVLEDSEMGIEAAFSAGIDCIAVPDMKVPGEAYAKKTRWIVDNLIEVIRILESDERT